MDERRNSGRSLEERVRRLEDENEQMRHELRYVLRRVNRLLSEGGPAPRTDEPGSGPQRPALAPRSIPETSAEPPHAASGRAVEGGRRFRWPVELGNLRSGEWWLNKVGIGLLLLGLAFLFMLAVERGWISPAVRVGFGLAVGATLLALGLRLRERRRAFSQVLLGGGIGALYTSGFAAFGLYALVSYPTAFAFMAGVTVTAFFLALRGGGVTLSLIGATGGLGTPFLLYTDSGTLGGLVLYTCLVLAGTGAVYLYRGWTSLLAVSFIGGWAVLLIGYANSSLFLDAQPLPDERLVLQLGVTFAWLLFSLAPTAREFLRDDGAGSAGPVAALGNTLVVSAALIALGFTEAVWQLPSTRLGWVALSGAVLYALAALALRSTGKGRIAYVHALVSLLLLTLASALMLREGTLLFTLAAQAAVLHLLARHFSARVLSAEAHLLSLVVAVWMAGRLLGEDFGLTFGPEGLALLNARAVLDLAVIASGFVSSIAVWPSRLRLVYRVAAHAALLALLWRELSGLPGGDAWVTVAWGLYAVGLLGAGVWLSRASVVRGGMAMLFVVVGKLFLVDLSEVEPVLRVFLFLGFGGLFLAVSYYLQGLWHRGPDRDRERRPGAGAQRS